MVINGKQHRDLPKQCWADRVNDDISQGSAIQLCGGPDNLKKKSEDQKKFYYYWGEG